MASFEQDIFHLQHRFLAARLTSCCKVLWSWLSVMVADIICSGKPAEVCMTSGLRVLPWRYKALCSISHKQHWCTLGCWP